MSRYDQYSDEELIFRLRQGEMEISDYLMEKYKEFVRKKARAMFLIGGETDDLIQEGMIGLFKAIQNYQADKETSFRTFASLCIDRQLYSAVQNSNRQKHQPLNSYVSLMRMSLIISRDPGQKIRKHLLLIRKVQELWNARSRKF